MLTEDEAKTKWCPMARTVETVSPGVGSSAPRNRVANVSGEDMQVIAGELLGAKCIGSACMMWRQGEKRNPDWNPPHYMIATTPQHPDDTEQPYVADPERGYCGLAGRP